MARVKPVALSEVLPYVERPLPMRPLCLDGGGEEFEADVQEVDFADTDYCIDVSNSLEAPGSLHVIHNLGRELETTFFLLIFRNRCSG